MTEKQPTETLTGHWGKSWSELPQEQREVWELEFATPELLKWDELDSNGRQRAIEKRESERSRYKTALQRFAIISNKEREFETLKKMTPPSPSEFVILNSELEKRRAEINMLKQEATCSHPEPFNAPSSPKSAESIDTTGMVAWQAAILESWEKLVEKHGNAITARQVMAWCKSSGPRDVFGCEQTGNRESIQWIDGSAGNVHSVTLARIGTVISGWRKSGKIPPRK